MPEQSQIPRPGLRDLTVVWVLKTSRVVRELMRRIKLRIKSHLGIAGSGNWDFEGYCPKPAYSRLSCTFLKRLMLVLSDVFCNRGIVAHMVYLLLCATQVEEETNSQLWHC